jgi:energy-coupling factor transporter ATP-binding protein EcfA2
MPRVDVVVETMIQRTARVAQIEGLFDLPIEKTSSKRWVMDAPIDDRPWHIGLIVGPSGCGKTTIAKEIFPAASARTAFDWPTNQAVIDGFPEKATSKQIANALNAVGFSSPPNWLRPFAVLSNGEKFRATMARCLLETDDLIVMDEFTSVVDRTVAKIGSAAIAKTIRRADRQFVAVSCHYDVIDWLDPDWVLQPATGEFDWRALRGRPPIRLDIVSCHSQDWRIFRDHHYLTSRLLQNAKCFVALVDGQPAAFSSWTRLRHNHVRNAMREHRTVVLPDFQGVGIGNILSEHCARIFRSQKWRVVSTTSAPSMIVHRAKSPLWNMIRAPSHVAPPGKTSTHRAVSGRRLTASFEFVGP